MKLGHALCQETDEVRAKAYADQLRPRKVNSSKRAMKR